MKSKLSKPNLHRRELTLAIWLSPILRNATPERIAKFTLQVEAYIRKLDGQWKDAEAIGNSIHSLQPDFDKEKLPTVMESDAVLEKMKQSSNLLLKAPINIVPSLLVNGKYVVKTSRLAVIKIWLMRLNFWLRKKGLRLKRCLSPTLKI